MRQKKQRIPNQKPGKARYLGKVAAATPDYFFRFFLPLGCRAGAFAANRCSVSGEAHVGCPWGRFPLCNLGRLGGRSFPGLPVGAVKNLLHRFGGGPIAENGATPQSAGIRRTRSCWQGANTRVGRVSNLRGRGGRGGLGVQWGLSWGAGAKFFFHPPMAKGEPGEFTNIQRGYQLFGPV